VEASTEISVRRLPPGEWKQAYTIIVQLRPHLDEAEFLRSVERQSHSG
jgi:hypothetical protein